MPAIHLVRARLGLNRPFFKKINALSTNRFG